MHDTQAAGAAERGSDAAAEGQSGTIGTGDGGSVWAQHTTTGCALTAHAPTYTTHHITAKPSGSRDEISDYIRPSIRNSPHRHHPSHFPHPTYRARMPRHTRPARPPPDRPAPPSNTPIAHAQTSATHRITDAQANTHAQRAERACLGMHDSLHRRHSSRFHAQRTDRACPGIHNSSCFGSLDGVILSAFSEGAYRCGSLCEPILTQRAPDQLNQLIPTNGPVSM